MVWGRKEPWHLLLVPDDWMASIFALDGMQGHPFSIHMHDRCQGDAQHLPRAQVFDDKEIFGQWFGDSKDSSAGPDDWLETGEAGGGGAPPAPDPGALHAAQAGPGRGGQAAAQGKYTFGIVNMLKTACCGRICDRHFWGLSGILEPFMLRRQGQDVEGKLPPKVQTLSALPATSGGGVHDISGLTLYDLIGDDLDGSGPGALNAAQAGAGRGGQAAAQGAPRACLASISGAGFAWPTLCGSGGSFVGVLEVCVLRRQVQELGGQLPPKMSKCLFTVSCMMGRESCHPWTPSCCASKSGT